MQARNLDRGESGGEGKPGLSSAALGNKLEASGLSAAFEGAWGKLVPPQSPRWGDNRGVDEEGHVHREGDRTGYIEILRFAQDDARERGAWGEGSPTLPPEGDMGESPKFTLANRGQAGYSWCKSQPR
jgi:hypothetical protein